MAVFSQLEFEVTIVWQRRKLSAMEYIHEYEQYVCFSVVIYLICLFPHELCFKRFETKWRRQAQQKENQLTGELIKRLAVDQSSRESGWWLCDPVLTKLWLKLFWFSSGSSFTQQLENDDVCPVVWIFVWLIPADDQTQRLFTNCFFFWGVQQATGNF